MILDSCFLIDLMAGDDGAVAKLDELVAEKRSLSVSALTVTEVERGLDGSLQESFAGVMADVDVVAYDGSMASRAAIVLRSLDDEGETIGALDAMVAATALERETAVVTRNIGEFRRVDGLRVTPY